MILKSPKNTNVRTYGAAQVFYHQSPDINKASTRLVARVDLNLYSYIPINIAGITDHDPIKNVFIDQIWIKCMDEILIN